MRKITLETLAEMIVNLKETVDTLATKDYVEERTFTTSEKEQILKMIEHLDQWMEDAVLGRNQIMLTREEYDATQKIAGFPHRFAD